MGTYVLKLNKVQMGPMASKLTRGIVLLKTKDVNGYSNIRIRSEYSNTISEFEYSHLFYVPVFLVIFLLFHFFSSKYSNAKL